MQGETRVERNEERGRLTERMLLWLGLVLWAMVLASWGCGSEEEVTAQNASCTRDADCTVGTICQASTQTCIVAPCYTGGEYNCQMGQICLETPEQTQGVCSRPECRFPSDCTSKPGTSCIGGQCLAFECTNDEECDDDEYCTAGNQCEAAPTECTVDADCKSPRRVCTAAGTCRPGCTTDDACPQDRFCDVAQKVCSPGCRDSTQCDGQLDTCGPDHQCVCSPDSCTNGTACVGGTCKMIASCDDVTCAMGQYCDPENNFACTEGCTTTGCDATPGTVCNPQTGRCIADMCGGKTAAACVGTDAPHFNPETCECIECLTFNDCDTADGEICNDGGRCVRCENACDSNTPGTCTDAAGGATPFCIAGCCSECIGDLDCKDASKPLCINGFCQAQPNCLMDPNACPTGYLCDAQGTCQPPATGGQCNPRDGSGCTPPLICNPQTSTCEQGGSTGMGCGTCNPDCTCNGSMQCNPLFLACTGCSGPLFPGFPGGDPATTCPSGQICFPGFAICLKP